MKKEINESITFLFNEYKRLKEKDKKEILLKEEKETLFKLKSFFKEEKND